MGITPTSCANDVAHRSFRSGTGLLLSLQNGHSDPFVQTTSAVRALSGPIPNNYEILFRISIYGFNLSFGAGDGNRTHAISLEG